MTSLSLSLEHRFPVAKTVAADVVKRTSDSEKITLAVKAVNLFRYIGCTSTHLLNNTKHLPMVGALKLVKLGEVPLTVHEMFSSFFSAKTTINEKVDTGLSLVSDVGSLTDVATSTMEGLIAVGVVAKEAGKWITPVSIVVLAMEGIEMIFLTKSLIEMHRFSKIFTEASSLDKSLEEVTIENFTKIRELILEKTSQEKSFISKHFKTDADKLNERLLVIESEAKTLFASESTEERLEGNHKVQTTIELLSKRMTVKKWSNALNLLIISISVIGFGLLFSPCPPIGFAFLAVSGVLSLLNFFLEKALTSEFEKELGISD